MKVFVTTRALTKGIEEVDVIATQSGIAVENINLFPRRFNKNDWFVDEESAVNRAEELRAEQINLLKEKIKKLEKLKFK